MKMACDLWVSKRTWMVSVREAIRYLNFYLNQVYHYFKRHACANLGNADFRSIVREDCHLLSGLLNCSCTYIFVSKLH